MNITFIVPDYNYLKHYMPDYRGSFHHGAAYICAFLKKQAHKVSLLHLFNFSSEKKFLNTVADSAPGLVAFTSFTHQFAEVKRLVSILKKNLSIPIICGGVHCTIDPERSLLESELDMVCIGEGEIAMLELANAIAEKSDNTQIESIWFKRQGRIIKNPVRPLIEDLDKLPFPDWMIFNYQSLTEGVIQKRASILATRGCPNNCSFCSNHAIKSVYPNKGKYVRWRKPEKVIEELGELLKLYPHLEEVCFLDDTMGLDQQWLKELSYLYKSKFSLPVHCNTRVEVINNDENLKSLKQMNVATVGLGFESADEEIRKLMKRHISSEETVRAVKRCHQAGIKVLSYNIVGNPLEDTEKILKTIKLNAKAKTDIIHVSIFQPYPNTDAYKFCVEKGFIKDGALSEGFFDQTILKQPTITKESITFAMKYFRIYVLLFRLAENLPNFFAKQLEKIIIVSFCDSLLQRICLKAYPCFVFIVSNKVIRSSIKNIKAKLNGCPGNS